MWYYFGKKTQQECDTGHDQRFDCKIVFTLIQNRWNSIFDIKTETYSLHT